MKMSTLDFYAEDTVRLQIFAIYILLGRYLKIEMLAGLSLDIIIQ
jgi:hypothetical protein